MNDDFAAHTDRYLESLRTRQYSDETVRDRKKMLADFARWSADRGVTRPLEATKGLLERYQRKLAQARKADGEAYSVKTQYNQLVVLANYFRWLARSNLILFNPAADLEMPRLPKRLPKDVFTPREVERVLAMPDVATPVGIRDRAILETVYSTGLRRMELTEAKLVDVDLDQGTIFVQKGKGCRERIVPVGERALGWLAKYLEEARPGFAREPDEGGYLFLTERGRKMTRGHLTVRLGAYVEASGVTKGGSVHIFRHAMATGMLEGGADIRFVQAMLGHAEISTTQIYTRVAIGKLRRVHGATHPAEQRKRKKRPKDPASPPPEAGAAPGPTPGAPSEHRSEGGPAHHSPEGGGGSPPGADGNPSKAADAASPDRGGGGFAPGAGGGTEERGPA